MTTTAMKAKVKKLLAKAAATEGTPESDIFYEKAFELMARYGFDASDLPADDADAAGMTHLGFPLKGAYTDMQMELLNSIAVALHCACVAVRKYRGVSVQRATVYGARRHVERVEMLFEMLRPTMLALAIDHASHGTGSAVARKRSFMQGFSGGIYRRLRAAEETVAETVDGYALQLRDDFNAAREFMNEKLAEDNASVKNHRAQRKIDVQAFTSGNSAAHNTDIGQTRVASRKALRAC